MHTTETCILRAHTRIIHVHECEKNMHQICILFTKMRIVLHFHTGKTEVAMITLMVVGSMVAAAANGKKEEQQ